MTRVSDLRQSRFLTKEDCEPPMLVTIKDCENMNVSMDGAPKEYKICLTFEETDKPLVLNHTNGQTIEQFAGTDIIEDWSGLKIVLFNDPSVSFGGKRTGGIRVRAPQGKAANINQNRQEDDSPPPTDDDTPF